MTDYHVELMEGIIVPLDDTASSMLHNSTCRVVFPQLEI